MSWNGGGMFALCLHFRGLQSPGETAAKARCGRRRVWRDRRRGRRIVSTATGDYRRPERDDDYVRASSGSSNQRRRQHAPRSSYIRGISPQAPSSSSRAASSFPGCAYPPQSRWLSGDVARSCRSHEWDSTLRMGPLFARSIGSAHLRGDPMGHTRTRLCRRVRAARVYRQRCRDTRTKVSRTARETPLQLVSSRCCASSSSRSVSTVHGA